MNDLLQEVLPSNLSGSVKSLLAYCRDKSRICPIPPRWNALWELLPNRKRVGRGWVPALPLILAAWHEASGLEKMLRLEEHIQWAARFNQLQPVTALLHGLREDEWFHLGD
jgi:hypothetical protein